MSFSRQRLRLLKSQQMMYNNCLRVIRNEWHFHYALVLVIKALCGSFVLIYSHRTKRYVNRIAQ